LLTSSGSNASVISSVTTSLPTATAKLLHIFGVLGGNKMDRKPNITQNIIFLGFIIHLPYKKYTKIHAILKKCIKFKGLYTF